MAGISSFDLWCDGFSAIKKSPGLVLKPTHAWKQENPLFICLNALVFMIIGTYIQTHRTRRYIWVDRLYSIAPMIYTVLINCHFFYHHKSLTNYRLILVSSLITAWGFRLTYNLYRRGGYGINYLNERLTVLRQQVTTKQWQWDLFVFLVIHCFLLSNNWMMTILPLYAIYHESPSNGGLSSIDFILTLAHLAFLVFESIADNQQAAFQIKKAIGLQENWTKSASYDENFISTGLFKYSRHPAYFGELGQWFVIFLFSRTPWTSIGSGILFLIVWRSSILSETLCMFKYPKYKYYANRTSWLFPASPGRRHAREALNKFER